MKAKVLLSFYVLAYYLGILELFYWLNRNKVLVLSYHNVIPDHLYDDSYHLGVSHCQSAFESQIRLIAKRFNTQDRPHSCQISFDDGYKNQVNIAAPILEKYRCIGIFFIALLAIEQGETLLIDKIMMWISYVPTGSYKIFGNSITINNDNRHNVADYLYALLKSNYKLWQVIEMELDKAFSFNSLAIHDDLFSLRFMPMSSQEVALLRQSGHLIGAHSWDHRPLSSLPLAEQRDDFAKCNQYAKKYCNSFLYSYPFGTQDEVSFATIQLCAESGFSKAYLNMQEIPREWLEKRNFALPRMTLPNESNLYLLEAKLSGFEHFCKKLILNMSSLIKRIRGLQWATKNISPG